MDRRTRFSISFLVFSSILLQVGVFIPLLLFTTNQDEFSVGFLDAVQHLVFPLLAILFIASTFSVFCSRKMYEKLISLALAVSFLMYLQSTFLVWRYGSFDGKEISWNEFVTQGRIDLGIWVMGLFLAFLSSSRITRTAKIFSFLILLLSGVGSLLPLLEKPVRWRSSSAKSHLNHSQLNGFYDFSTKKNIIYILLDGFLSPAFEKILSEDNAQQNAFSDFTYFRNTLGSFPTTSPSIPTIFSGRDYDNSLPLSKFLQDSLYENSFPSILHKNGFQVNLVTLGHYCNHLQTSGCGALEAYNANDTVRLERKELSKLIDISLFRLAPQVLKKEIYNDQDWLFQRFYQRRKGPPIHVESLEFVDTLLSKAQATSSAPTLKFIHLIIPHSPVRLNANCQARSTKKDPEMKDYLLQARCGLKLAHDIIDTIKALQIYDQSMIIISADHGFRIKFDHPGKKEGLPPISSALPLLLVKPFGHHGPLQVSEVPARLADIGTTIEDALDLNKTLPGQSLFTLTTTDSRVRPYRYYRWNHRNWKVDSLPPTREYLVEGHAWDETSWRFHRELPPFGAAVK